MEGKKTNTTHNFRIITFNLLSPKVLSEESILKFYPTIKKKYLDFNSRVEKTKKLLQSWMKVNFIICVQEMSTQWYNILTEYFRENNYGFHAEVYSGGKMGVGIGFPLNHFDIIAMNSFTCGPYITSICNDIKQLSFVLNTQQKPETFMDDDYAKPETFMDDDYAKPETSITAQMITELEYASDSTNVLLSVLLCPKYLGNIVGQNVVISTFHMPCRYKYKYYICSHIHAINMHLLELTMRWNALYNNTVSIVLCGDFNITPKSPEYNLLVGLTYTANDLAKPDISRDNKTESAHFIAILSSAYQAIRKNLFDGMRFRSTHRTLHSKEPNYTNVMIQNDRTFVECIDYILINNQVDIRSCTVGLSVYDPVSSPCPNGLCPSDHLPLSASLML